MNLENLCGNCMNYKTADRCSECGWIKGNPAEHPLYLAPGSILNEQYVVGRVLGCGGFAITYLGWDTNLNIKVAIKEYLPRDLATRDPQSSRVTAYTGEAKENFTYGLERFVDEARMLARFNGHPGIVSVSNFFKANGTGYIVMGYVTGVTFKEYLDQRGGKLPFETALGVMTPVMDTLREVHGAGLLHRDVSPDNIYITTSRQVKLLDFGAARFAVSEKSQNLSTILKPGFAPEEQYRRGGKQGPWTDVYAVGATFYRAITGQMPPEAPDRLEHDFIVPPARLGVRIDAAAESALMRALAVRRERRFQDVSSFQASISHAIAVRMARCTRCGAENQEGARACSSCGLAFAGETRPASELRYAGFFRRAAAALVDSILLGFVWVILFFMFEMMLQAMRQSHTYRGTSDDQFAAGLLLTSLFTAFVAWLYSSILECSRAQGTLGKMLLGLAVSDTQGERISFFRATLRFLGKGLSFSFCGIGLLAAAFTEKKQAIHDSISGCLVILKN